MKTLVVTAKFKKPRKPVIPNLDRKDPSYNYYVKQLIECKKKQPDLYNSIMYWD